MSVVVTCFPPSQCSDGCGQPTAHNELGQTRAVHTALEDNAVRLNWSLRLKTKSYFWCCCFGGCCWCCCWSESDAVWLNDCNNSLKDAFKKEILMEFSVMDPPSQHPQWKKTWSKNAQNYSIGINFGSIDPFCTLPCMILYIRICDRLHSNLSSVSVKCFSSNIVVGSWC